VQRGPSERSAKLTRPMELIGLLKVMMKNEKTALYEFFSLYIFKFLLTYSLVYFATYRNQTSTGSEKSSTQVGSETEQGSTHHSGPLTLFAQTFSTQRSAHANISVTFSPPSVNTSLPFSATTSSQVSPPSVDTSLPFSATTRRSQSSQV
jgi:hypothetical protein